ncbi:MAG TPA: lysophospholipid acyltransferase family protein, partial [Longimicrobiales bacterium]|nr:lysophospholipid acyltransferase family protein [Longimicrobiales bacterium]
MLAHVLLLRPLLKLVFGVGVEGRENLDGMEQMILVANHNSHLDTLLLFQLLPRRLIPRTHPVAALDYFGERRWMLALARFLFRPVWIRRGEGSEEALEGMRERLRAGHSVIVFPEGTRGEPGDMTRFRKGVGRLAGDFRHVPVVPVFLAGAERALPRSAAVPVPVWARVVVGLPQRFEGRAAEVAGALERMVRELGDSEMGRRHRRRVRPRHVPTVAVLGIDGSGKSSLSRELARHLSDRWRVCLVSDRTELFEAGEPGPPQPLVT